MISGALQHCLYSQCALLQHVFCKHFSVIWQAIGMFSTVLTTETSIHVCNCSGDTSALSHTGNVGSSTKQQQKKGIQLCSLSAYEVVLMKILSEQEQNKSNKYLFSVKHQCLFYSLIFYFASGSAFALLKMVTSCTTCASVSTDSGFQD